MPLLDVFWTMLWFFLWILWFFLLFRVLLDIFRSRDLGGWGKAGWVAFVIILPFLGVLVYLIARGRKMTDRDVAGAADELAKLADLRDHGVISEAEFQQGKQKILQTAA